MAYITDTHRAGTGILAGLMTFPANLAARVTRYRAYRKTIAELSTLSARELDDLGLERSMIASIAFEAAYGKKG